MRSEFENSEAWHNRGYLPHYDEEKKYQMITCRLGDSLPKEVLQKLEDDLAGSADLQSASTDDKNAIQKRKLIEKYLDKGYGSCLLADPRAAEIVVDAWKYFDNERYDLIAYVVMPNHVHLLIKTYEDWPLGDLVKSWKRQSTKAIRQVLGGDLSTVGADCKSAKLREPGNLDGGLLSALDADCKSALPGILREGNSFWQREYWDRFIRDKRHYISAVDYIHNNPVKASLCKEIKDWPWSSALKELNDE